MNKQIAEKLGWETYNWSDWKDSDGNIIKQHKADFTHSLDACVKYIVPDMEKKGFRLTLRQLPDGTWDALWDSDMPEYEDTTGFMGNDKKPEMAVCKAFMEV